jgi:hypothetical protein
MYVSHVVGARPSSQRQMLVLPGMPLADAVSETCLDGWEVGIPLVVVVEHALEPAPQMISSACGRISGRQHDAPVFPVEARDRLLLGELLHRLLAWHALRLHLLPQHHGRRGGDVRERAVVADELVPCERVLLRVREHVPSDLGNVRKREEGLEDARRVWAEHGAGEERRERDVLHEGRRL